MEIIQIDITNQCVHRCSNCTRFCGHHKKPFFMSFETFKQAVDSLDGYNGIVGVIGGEPTIHPEFEKFAKYIASKRLKQPVTIAREPIAQILPYIEEHAFLPLDAGCKSGLWSSLNRAYYKHFEVINESFDYQALNDHNNTCMHQALLMSRKECGLSDEEWIPQRDNCWIQNKWSATITPKGAFFCEVAGALDMLFNGPGGWPIEKDWWKREPKDFQDQLHWCELCSCGFDVPKRLSTDGRDDVTPMIYEKLKELGSPKALKGLVVVHTKEDYQFNKEHYKAFTDSTSYMDDNHSVRIQNSPNIMPREFKIYPKKSFSKKIKKDEIKDWVIIADNRHNGKLVKEYLSKMIINPGCLYRYKDVYAFNILATSIRNVKNIDNPIYTYYPEDKIINIKPQRKFSYGFKPLFFIFNQYENEKEIIKCHILGFKISFKIQA